VFVRVSLCVLGGIVALEAGPVRAEDLDAGKSGPRLFATSCSFCHRNGSLAYFLRRHYTASSQQASVLTGYLLSLDTGASPRKTESRGRWASTVHTGSPE
jgi:hypothetical protein